MILIGEILGFLKSYMCVSYNMFSTKSNPHNQKRTPKSSPHKKTPHRHTKIPAHTRQGEPTKTKPRPHNNPQRSPLRHSAPHPPSDGRHKITPSKRAPTPPRQHTITLPSTQQPSLRALKKIPMRRHKKQGRTHPNQSCTDHQTANGRHCTDTENTRKPPRRHSPVPTGPHHPVHTKTPACPHRAPRKPVPRAPLQPRKPPLSREDVLSFIGW